MDVSNLSSVLSTTVQRAETTNRAAAGRVEREREEDPAGRPQGPRRGGQLFKALAQTLSELGFGAPGDKGAPPATASQANDAESAAANSGQNAGQALHGFMHALFQALGATGGNNAPAAPRNAPDSPDTQGERATAVGERSRRAYGDIESRLQNLVQSLASSSTPATASDVAVTENSALETSFQNLTTALQAESATGSARMPDLQSFLQKLQQNLLNAGSRLDSSGNLVNTIA